MKKVSMATRAELVEAVGERYRTADRRSKGRVLDQFVAVTGFHRRAGLLGIECCEDVAQVNVRGRPCHKGPKPA